MLYSTDSEFACPWCEYDLSQDLNIDTKWIISINFASANECYAKKPLVTLKCQEYKNTNISSVASLKN